MRVFFFFCVCVYTLKDTYMGLRSMKKIIESFWVTVGESQMHCNDTHDTCQSYTESEMTYQITSRRHLPSSSSMTTERDGKGVFKLKYNLVQLTFKVITATTSQIFELKLIKMCLTQSMRLKHIHKLVKNII